MGFKLSGDPNEGNAQTNAAGPQQQRVTAQPGLALNIDRDREAARTHNRKGAGLLP